MAVTNQAEKTTTTRARDGHDVWDVTIRPTSDGGYRINGRMSELRIYIQRTVGGYMVSVPQYQRCGEVPSDCSTRNIEDYCGLDNPVDAATIAAGVRAIVGADSADGR